MKIGSFITSIALFIVAGVMTFICYDIGLDMSMSGIKTLALIILIPISILFYLILAGVLFSGTVASIRAIGSESKGIKITSIVFTVLFVCLIALNAYVAISVYHVLFLGA